MLETFGEGEKKEIFKKLLFSNYFSKTIDDFIQTISY
jgi:hypothetical protein